MVPTATRDLEQVNGYTNHEGPAIQKIKSEGLKRPKPPTALTDEQDLVLRTFRLLIADLCQQFNGGHPG